MKLTVTVLDTTGIQAYIFGGNRLRENVGASYLVAQATGAWVEDILEKELNVPKGRQREAIDVSGLDAELVYAGGGNTVLLFREPEETSAQKSAIKFTQILSQRILREAPGINLVVAHHHGFDWDTDELHKTIQHLMQHDLDKKKRGRVASAPLLGLGVTTTCLSTQLVAVDTSDRHSSPTNYPVSREVIAKLDAVEGANNDLKAQIFDPKEPLKYRIPLDFDDFSRSKGDISYLAVVHADGNSMGQRFQDFGKETSNREYINRMRSLSDSVNAAGVIALKAVAKTVVDSIQNDNDVDAEGKPIKVFKGKTQQFQIYQNKYLPFRPLVYGGDDVTFVCDGRIGLELAALYLKAFEQQPVADNKPLTACAGVSIVKVHYPFARSYELAEALCKSAKKIAKFESDSGKRSNSLSALDWHLAATGLSGSIASIREREYQVSAGKLTLRPVLLQAATGEWRTWEYFVQIVEEFQKKWGDRQNKVMALREVLRQGPEATEQFLHVYRQGVLPPYSEEIGQQRDGFSQKGWLNGICGYFDPIEAMEFYFGLEDGKHVDLYSYDQIAE